MIDTLDIQSIIENLTTISVLVLWLRLEIKRSDYYRERSERHEEALIEAFGEPPKSERVVKRLRHGVVED